MGAVATPTVEYLEEDVWALDLQLTRQHATYYMRAEADPGPGYVLWSSSIKDYTGRDATAPIIAGTVVLLKITVEGS